MSSSQISSSSSVSDTRPAPAAKDLGNLATEYVFSWRWFLGGLATLLIVSGGLVGLYYYQIGQLPKYILATSEQLEKDGRFQDAINLLDSYRASHAGNTQIRKRLTDLFDRLPEAESLGFDRYAKAISVNREIKNRLTGNEALDVSNRLVRWEWEAGHPAKAMEEARELIVNCEKQGKPRSDFPLPWQVYAKVKFNQMIQGQVYRPDDLTDVPNMPYAMDELLAAVYALDPKDIEIAEIFAEFKRNYENDNFTKNASVALTQLTPEQRISEANRIMNDMVARNPEVAKAYLVRYRYRARHNMLDRFKPGLDADLRKAIELEPGYADARLQAGAYLNFQAVNALQRGDEATFKKIRDEVIEQYETISKYNPRNVAGYASLGALYYAQRNIAKAVEVWAEGAEKIRPAVDTQLHGRLILGLLELGRFEQAQQELNHLDTFLRSRRASGISSPDADRQAFSLRILLQARIFAAEGAQFLTKAEQERLKGNEAEANQLQKLGQDKLSDAMVLFDDRLFTFGRLSSDYQIEREDIYSHVVVTSLVLYARMLADQGKWSMANEVYRKISAFPDGYFPNIKEDAVIGQATSLQELGRQSESLEVLRDASTQYPKNETVRFLLTQTLFNNEMQQDAAVRNFSAIEEEVQRLEENKASLPQPWAVDILKIRMQFVRDSSSDNVDKAVAAQQVAIQQYHELEKHTFPPRPGELPGDVVETRTYDQDVAFLSAIGKTYSSLGSVYDFERVIGMLRELPDGLFAYYDLRVFDAEERRDNESLAAIITEALSSDLTDKQKQVFSLRQRRVQLAGDPMDSEQVYEQLEREFVRNPDALKPQALFSLASGAIERSDWKAAQVYEDRLRQMEGDKTGIYWRFIQARRILNQDPKSPQFARAKELQQEIVAISSEWDMAYVLGAFIEERAPLAEGDTENARRIREIELYKLAVRYGNTNPEVWNALIGLLIDADMADEARRVTEQALYRGVRIRANQGRFPMPYQQYYQEVFKALDREDIVEADRQARACVILAQRKKESAELIFDLNTTFGKMFMDANYTDHAEKFLRALYVRGGAYVYPLAVCMAKAGRVDEGFTIILDEIEKTPSSASALIPAILVLLSQVVPSEEVFARIDELMMRIENGQREVFDGVLEKGDQERDIMVGEKRIFSAIIRFPGQTEIPDPATITPLYPERQEMPIPEFDDSDLTGRKAVPSMSKPEPSAAESAPTTVPPVSTPVKPTN